MRHPPVSDHEAVLDCVRFLRSLDDSPLKQIMAGTEMRLIAEALLRNDRNVIRAAEDLGLSRQNLHQKIVRYHLGHLSAGRGRPITPKEAP